MCCGGHLVVTLVLEGIRGAGRRLSEHVHTDLDYYDESEGTAALYVRGRVVRSAASGFLKGFSVRSKQLGEGNTRVLYPGFGTRASRICESRLIRVTFFLDRLRPLLRPPFLFSCPRSGLCEALPINARSLLHFAALLSSRVRLIHCGPKLRLLLQVGPNARIG